MTSKPQGSATNGNSNGNGQHVSNDDLAKLFMKILEETKVLSQTVLTEQAKEAVDYFNRLKVSLQTPKVGKDLPDLNQWKKPELNETAKPDQTNQSSKY
jgi:hypothetical protein